VLVEVGAERQPGLAYHVLGHQLGSLLEVLRRRQDLGQLAGQVVVRPDPVGRLDGLLLGGREADLCARLHRLAAALAEAVDGVLVRRRRDEAVADARCDVDRLRPEARDVDRRRLVRQREDASVLDRVVSTAMAERIAAPESAHDLDRLLEHLQPHVRLGPAVAENVLVERLAGADAEGEAAVEQDLRGGRGLGDYGGVDADGRARDGRRHRQADAGGGESADHAPDERRLALLVVPGVVVVRDPERAETGLLGDARLS